MGMLSEGLKLAYSTTGAVTNGDLLLIADTPAVALNTATGAGVTITVATEGVFSLSRKASAGAVSMGSKAYYVATGGVNKITSVAATGACSQCVGVYAETTTTAATTCKVKLLASPIF